MSLLSLLAICLYIDKFSVKIYLFFLIMKKIFMSLAIVLAVILIFLGYQGAFNAVEPNEKMTGPYYLVYQQYTGDYSKMGPLMDKMHEDFVVHDRVIGSGIGIFYDDPQNVDTDKLRSDIGMVVKSSDFEKIGALSGAYLTQTLPQANRLLTSFPYKNKMSFVVGVFKVYPEMNKYLEKHNYAYDVARVEMYDEESIQYLVEIIKK